MGKIRSLNKKTTSVVATVVLISIIILASRALFSQGFPRSDDFDIHAARIANYYLALKQGQLPPRWAPNTNSSFGYPIFNFIYPLPYIMGAGFFMIGVSIEQSINTLLIGAISLAVVGAYLLAKSYKLRESKALLAPLIYVSFPYYLVNIFIRGALGEIIFISLLPITLFFMRKLMKQPSKKYQALTSLALFLLFISHQLSVVYTLPIVIGWMLLESKKKSIRPLIISFIIAILSAQFFILPMVVESAHTNLSQHASVKNYHHNFVSLKDVVWSKWQYAGFSTSGEDSHGTFSRMIGIPSLTILALVIMQKRDKKTLYWLAVLLGSIFLMNKGSDFIWRNSTILPYIQFPFRFLSMSLLATIFLYMGISQKQSISPIIWILVCMSAIGQLIFFAKPIGYIQKNTYEWLEYPKNLDASNENMPMWFDEQKNANIVSSVFAHENHEVDIQIIDWNGSDMKYKISTDKSVQMIQKTAYFPGWEVWVDNKKFKIMYQNEQYPGVITYMLPAGNHLVRVRHTQNTPARKVGNTLSLVGIAGFIWQITKKNYAG